MRFAISPAFVALVAVTFGAACSSGETPTPAASDAGAVPPGDASPDASAVDCTAQRTPRAAPVCGNDCDVRLYLPAGDSYCTMTCVTSKDCEGLGPGLVCSAAMGTCAPACASASECAAKGFATCDAAGACDTQ